MGGINLVVSPPLTDDLAPTIPAQAYAANEAMGGKMTLNLPMGTISESDHGPVGIVQAATLLNLDSQAKRIALFLFREDYTDPGSGNDFALSDADMEKCIGYIVWEANHFHLLTNNAIAVRSALGLAGKVIGGHWYAQFVAMEALTTSTANALKGKLAGIIT